MSEESDLEISYKKGIQIIKLNRPLRKNALRKQVYEELPVILATAASDERVILSVLTAAGDYFSSGNDLQSAFLTSDNILEEVEKACARLREFVAGFIDYPKLLIAVVNGPAIGIAGTILALCDIVYAADTAWFQTPFTSLGLSPEACSTYTFPRILGNAMASKMLYCGYKMSAHEAKECGMVSEVIPKDQLESVVWPKLEQLCNKSHKSILYTKKLLRDVHRSALHEANKAEVERLKERFQSEDCMNALIAFLTREKRLSKL